MMYKEKRLLKIYSVGEYYKFCIRLYIYSCDLSIIILCYTYMDIKFKTYAANE